ncbi:hypothetical protein BYT27DRAFT_7255706 [Phlegmacium glaucopus]|nr:hypothetical protein BYT27DRAFT_7255706 [Phlegmacium glaucopus]
MPLTHTPLDTPERDTPMHPFKIKSGSHMSTPHTFYVLNTEMNNGWFNVQRLAFPPLPRHGGFFSFQHGIQKPCLRTFLPSPHALSSAILAHYLYQSTPGYPLPTPACSRSPPDPASESTINPTTDPPMIRVYTGCFVLYLYLHAMKTLEAPDPNRNFLIYPLCTLYGLSAVKFVLDIKDTAPDIAAELSGGQYTSCNIQLLLFPFTEYFDLPMLDCVGTQNVCYNPSIAFGVCDTRLVKSLAIIIYNPWTDVVTFTKGLYLAIDGLVMGSVVLKIVMAYLEVRPVMAHSGRENKFSPSRLYILHLDRVWQSIEDAVAYVFIARILRQVPLNGIIPTIILVREALGMSYNDITPISQTIESLHFAHNDALANSNQEVDELNARVSDAQDIFQANRSSIS